MSTCSVRKTDQMQERIGFSHPLFFFAAFLLCTVAMNAEWSGVRLVWWSVLAFFVCVWFMTSGGKMYLDKHYAGWLITFVAFCGLSYFWASSASLVANVMRSLVVNVFILILLRSSLRNKGDLYRFLIVIAGAAVINSFYLLINNFSEMAANTDKEIGTRLGEQGGWNANAVGMLAAISVLVFLYLFQKNTKQYKKILCLVFAVAMVFISLLTGSRKAFIIILGGTIVYLLLTSKKKRLQTVMYIVFFVWILLYISMETEFFYSIIGNRIDGFLALLTGKGEADSSAVAREKLIDIAIDVWKQFPVLGCGLDCFRLFSVEQIGRDYYAHNNYVELLADLGIIGTMIYYSGPFYLLVSLLKKLKNKENESKLFFTFLGTILVMDYACVSYMDFLFSLVFLAIFSYVSINDEEKKLCPQR